MSDIKTKTWTTVATVDSFEEADLIRTALKEKYDSVKIRCAGKGGDIFRVKAWNPPPVKEKQTKSKGKFKKGK
jgi:hypothetical protein